MPTQSVAKNRILAALPASEFAQLAHNLTHVNLALGESMHRAGDLISYVYFVESGFISALTVLSDGQPLEIGLIGAEGVAGVSVILGATHSYSETMCQTGGGAYRITAAALREVVTETPHLRDLLLRYVHVFSVQVAQTAACNAHHELSQRLARWLLSAHDRSGAPQLALTQDLIAVMLGVRRSTVSIAASMLQRAGVIRYQHGRITITDRAGLENAACECHDAVATEYRALFGENATGARP
ncbi:MAG: Crp/Fnr family transcriptional regulator [Alphaproteobacteria bacterium]|nr:MAG: Crp/Fnr family transcriptional regulator [Alphaproteobacteria bacterium]